MGFSNNDYQSVHAFRFKKSLEWLQPYLKEDTLAVELGGYSPFSMLMPQLGSHLIAANDLRYRFPLKSDSLDLVLCMEVIEHVADTDGLHTEWQGDGARTMLKEVLRILKPGGVMFLTTPNAASITAIHHALRLAAGMIYRPHVREYSPYELDCLVREAGFEIVRRETLDVWRNAISDAQYERIAQFITDAGYPKDLRGEDIFMLARRPF